jgi:hypothetical protein
LKSTYDGHDIPADYIYCDKADDNTVSDQGESDYSERKNRDTVIMVHGLGGNRKTIYPVAQVFLERGYNVVAYDQRSSGENKAENTTFGFKEKYDLRDVANRVKGWATDKKMGIWGTSYGGITTVLAVCDPMLEITISTDFMILDSPISNAEDMMRDQMEEMDTGIPVDYMVWCGNIMTKLEMGFTYKKTDGRYIIKTRKNKFRSHKYGPKNKDVPLLIFNSKADELTPYQMGKDLYDVYDSDNKKLVTFENADHACGWALDEEQYRQEVNDFISSIK